MRGMVQYNNQEYKEDEKSKDGGKTDLKNVRINIEILLFSGDFFFPATLAGKDRQQLSL